MMKIRGHHLLCLSRKYGVMGGWYNRELFEHVKKKLKQIKGEPIIKIVNKCDDICVECPHIKRKKCDKPSKYKISHWVKVMDNKTLRLIKIKPHTSHKALELFNLTIACIKNKELKRICKGCEFLPYCLKNGLNKLFIKNLK